MMTTKSENRRHETSFHDLPPELRNRIYALVITCRQGHYVVGDRHLSRCGCLGYALLNVSSLVRRDIQPMFFSQHDVHVSLRRGEKPFLADWLNNISDHALRSMRAIHLTTRSSISAEPTVETVTIDLTAKLINGTVIGECRSVVQPLQHPYYAVNIARKLEYNSYRGDDGFIAWESEYWPPSWRALGHFVERRRAMKREMAKKCGKVVVLEKDRCEEVAAIVHALPIVKNKRRLTREALWEMFEAVGWFSKDHLRSRGELAEEVTLLRRSPRLRGPSYRSMLHPNVLLHAARSGPA